MAEKLHLQLRNAVLGASSSFSVKKSNSVIGIAEIYPPRDRIHMVHLTVAETYTLWLLDRRLIAIDRNLLDAQRSDESSNSSSTHDFICSPPTNPTGSHDILYALVPTGNRIGIQRACSSCKALSNTCQPSKVAHQVHELEPGS